MRLYRPPPAHAHAQPAQAQAQAQAQPPLLPELRPLWEEEGLGGGLVTWVTPLVKPVTLRTMLLAVPSIPRTSVATQARVSRAGSGPTIWAQRLGLCGRCAGCDHQSRRPA